MKHRVTLIPGDGIGPSVIEEAVKVVSATGVDIEWDEVYAGEEVMEREGTPLPENVLQKIRENKVALKGPITTPVASGFRSVNVEIRKRLKLFANVRPAIYFEGTGGVEYPELDLVVVRENTEGLYSGVEHYVDEERTCAESIKIITRKASERVIRFAFEYARKKGKRKVTLVHKANILKFTDGLFLEVGRELSREFPDIEFEDKIIDNMCMQLVRKPGEYQVIVTMNLYGDILSDLAAGLMGGLGLAPSGNFGEECAVFEPVHGSAPKYQGKNRVNPCATILAAAMMLEYLGEKERSDLIWQAVREVIREGKFLTYDLKRAGEPVGTREMGEAIKRKVEELRNG